MSIKLEVTGHLGKDPYVQTIGEQKVVVLSVASRKPNSRHADWITGTIWDKKLQQFVLSFFKKGDHIKAFGLVSKLSVYSSEGKWKPGLDMFINAIQQVHITKENADGRDV
jgi:hypothetical protein